MRDVTDLWPTVPRGKRRVLRAGAGLGLLLLLLGGGGGCTISDADRCPDGYTYRAEFKACLLDVQEDDTDSCMDPVDAGPDGGANPTGMNEPCMDATDCETFDANFCLTNPMAPDDPGICTVTNCCPADCPTGYMCCNCPQDINACMDDAAAAQGMEFGCECQ